MAVQLSYGVVYVRILAVGSDSVNSTSRVDKLYLHDVSTFFSNFPYPTDEIRQRQGNDSAPLYANIQIHTSGVG